MTMMVADTVIAGRYGTADLAGVAIGSSYYISVVMLLTGTLQAVAPEVIDSLPARQLQFGVLQSNRQLCLRLTVEGLFEQPVAVLVMPQLVGCACRAQVVTERLR